MTDFEKFIKEQTVDLETINNYIDSEEFEKLAGPVIDFGDYKYEVRDSEIEGYGIIATQDFAKGDVIGYGMVDGCRTLAGRYTNHAKNNNAKFYYFKENNNMILIAENDIELDEEIVVNYRHHTDLRSYYE